MSFANILVDQNGVREAALPRLHGAISLIPSIRSFYKGCSDAPAECWKSGEYHHLVSGRLEIHSGFQPTFEAAQAALHEIDWARDQVVEGLQSFSFREAYAFTTFGSRIKTQLTTLLKPLDRDWLYGVVEAINSNMDMRVRHSVESFDGIRVVFGGCPIRAQLDQMRPVLEDYLIIASG